MNRKTQEEMLPIVSSYRAYSGTKKSFCKERGINLHVFNYWQKKLNSASEESKRGGFIPLEVSDIKSSEQLELHYPNGNWLILSENSSLSLIESLIKLSI